VVGKLFFSPIRKCRTMQKRNVIRRTEQGNLMRIITVQRPYTLVVTSRVIPVGIWMVLSQVQRQEHHHPEVLQYICLEKALAPTVKGSSEQRVVNQLVGMNHFHRNGKEEDPANIMETNPKAGI
jgi:hypothetical protein